jgi:hypothetical protein
MIRTVLLKSARWYSTSSSSAYRLLTIQDGKYKLLSKKQTIGLLLFTGTSLSAYTFYQLQPTQRLYCDAFVTSSRSKSDKPCRKSVEGRLNERSETYIPSASAGFKRFDFAQAGR